MYNNSYTSTTNFAPMKTALPAAQQSLTDANEKARLLALAGLSNQSSTLQAGGAQAQQFYNPYIQQGQTALQTAGGIAGQWDPAQFDAAMANPALQARIKAGVTAADYGAGAKGNLFTGAHQAELQNIGQTEANKYLNDLYTQNYNLAGLGSQNAANAGLASQNTATQVGGVQGQMGNVGANSAIAQGNIDSNTALELAKADIAQSTARGLQTGQIANSGLAAYNPNTNPDPWGNRAAMQAGSLTAQRPTNSISGGGGGGGGTNGSSSSQFTPTTSTFSEIGLPRTATSNLYSQTGSAIASGAAGLAGSSVLGSAGASLGTNFGDYNTDGLTNQAGDSLGAFSGFAPGGSGAAGAGGAFGNVAADATGGAFVEGAAGAGLYNATAAGSAFSVGSSNIPNPGGLVPEETWGALKPASQTKVAQQFSDLQNQFPNLQGNKQNQWNFYVKGTAAARLLPGPEQNALLEAIYAAIPELRN